MKKFYRRSISGLLALLICFTTILGSSVTALATSVPAETAKSYSVAFPRNGDANLDTSGTWGHDELHYMNGWTSGEKTWMTTLHTILQQQPFHFVHAQRRAPAHSLLFIVVLVMAGRQNKRQLLVCGPYLVQKVHAGTVRQVEITADHQRHFLLDGGPRFFQRTSRFYRVASVL